MSSAKKALKKAKVAQDKGTEKSSGFSLDKYVKVPSSLYLPNAKWGVLLTAAALALIYVDGKFADSFTE